MRSIQAVLWLFLFQSLLNLCLFVILFSVFNSYSKTITWKSHFGLGMHLRYGGTVKMQLTDHTEICNLLAIAHYERENAKTSSYLRNHWVWISWQVSISYVRGWNYLPYQKQNSTWELCTSDLNLERFDSWTISVYKNTR